VVVSGDETKKPNGIFTYLVDVGSFVDTARVGVSGQGLPPELDGLVDVRNTASLSKKSSYARCLTATSRETRNPITVAYGKAPRWPAIPDAMVVFRSEVVPLSGSQLLRALEQLFPTANRVEFSQLEFAFDISAPDVATIRKQAVHRARRTCSLVDDEGRRTFYAGSQFSPWELRVYQKTENICRIELIFRRRFVVENGLLRPIDLLKLRVLDLETLVSFRRVSPERLEEAAPERSAKWRQAVVRWAERWPISKLPAYLRDQGIPPGKVLRRTELQRKIESMQKRFIW
jgi:hypothetical protein